MWRDTVVGAGGEEVGAETGIRAAMEVVKDDIARVVESRLTVRGVPFERSTGSTSPRATVGGGGVW